MSETMTVYRKRKYLCEGQTFNSYAHRKTDDGQAARIIVHHDYVVLSRRKRLKKIAQIVLTFPSVDKGLPGKMMSVRDPFAAGLTTIYICLGAIYGITPTGSLQYSKVYMRRKARKKYRETFLEHIVRNIT